MENKLTTPIPLWLALTSAAVIELFLLFALLDIKIPNPIPPLQTVPPLAPVSDEVADIERDFHQLNVNDLDSDLAPLEQEVNR